MNSQIEKAALWLADQPTDLADKMPLIQKTFNLSAAQAAQALTLANQYRRVRK